MDLHEPDWTLNGLPEAISARMVDHWTGKGSGVGSIPGTMLKSSGIWQDGPEKGKKFSPFFHSS